MTDRTPADEPGYILAEALYTLDEFQRRLRLGEAAMRAARRQGLRVRKVGRRKYVLGRDALQWIEGLDRQKKPG